MRGGLLALGVVLLIGACAPAPAPEPSGAGPAMADTGVVAADTDADADALIAPGDAAPVAGDSIAGQPDEPAAVPAPPAEAAPVLPPILAERARACTRDGGRFVPRGNSGLHACMRTTPDGGQRCTRSTDCEGLCLARSGTCAPYAPLYGCHEVLMNNGARATQCLE